MTEPRSIIELNQRKSYPFAHTRHPMADDSQSPNGGEHNLSLIVKPTESPSSPPRVARRVPNARDITTEFIKAASGLHNPSPTYACVSAADLYIALNTGQLVKDDFFTLFEAVGALEVRHHNTNMRKAVGEG